MTDNDPDVRWMTYAEAAKALGVTPETVARRMRRQDWAKRLGNDGKPRVAIPFSVLDKQAANEQDKTDVLLALTARAARSEGEAAVLRELVAQAEMRAADAERRLEEERQRFAATEQERAGEVVRLRQEREEARVQAAEQRAWKEGYRLAYEERRRPWWRRWLG